HRSGGNVVSDGFEVGGRLLYDLVCIETDARHVLDDNELRPQYLRGAPHTRIQLVLGVLATGLVVEVAVSLAGGSPYEQRDLGVRRAGGFFLQGERIAEGTVEVVLDGCCLDVRRGEVVCEYSG